MSLCIANPERGFFDEFRINQPSDVATYFARTDSQLARFPVIMEAFRASDLNANVLRIPQRMLRARLWLPDAETTLETDPSYAVRLANQDLWQASTGMHLRLDLR